MAIVETGLGWYAEDRWLMDAAGTIGELSTGGGQSGGYIVVPPVASGEPIVLLATITNPGNIIYVGARVASGSDEVRMYMAQNTDGRATPFFVSTAQFSVYYYAGTDPAMPFSSQYASAFDVASQLYNYGYPSWFASTGYSIIPSITPTVGHFNGNWTAFFQEVALAISGGGGSTVTYAKSSAGYSVTCICKWVTEVGANQYCSPVLISSEQNNTLYTRNSAVPSVPTTEHTYQGMTFYMRKAPLDTLDGSETLSTVHPVVDLGNLIIASNDFIFSEIARRSGLGVGYPPQEEDPYSGGSTSEPGGGGGTFDDTSDTIDDSTLPTFSFAATGFTRIYNPSLSELNALANYMWTDTNFLQTVINHLKQLIENPMDAVISLSRVPVPVPQGTAEEVKVMYIPTGVFMAPATTQFVDVDCGSLFIDEHYGSALDYNPYTKVSLFLPFVGMVNLDTDEVMNKTLFVKYRVDIVSGACVAKVFVGDSNDKSCLYQYSGDCSIAMPINSADFSGYKAAVIGAAKAVALGAAAAGSGLTAAAEAARFESAVSGGAEITFTEEQKSQYEKAMSNISSSVKNTPEKASFADAAKKQTSNTVGSVVSGKIEVEHSGGFSGNTGVLGIRRPYVVIKRPDMCNPEQYGKYNGRPCQMYLSLGSLSGYTEVQSIQLTGFSATNPELAEIAGLLKGGVIL